MNRSVVALLACVVCLIGLYAALGQVVENPAEKPGPTDGAIVVGQPDHEGGGRYQMMAFGDRFGGSVVVIDRRTGQCWTRDTDGPGKWRNLGSPVAAKP